MIRWTAWWTVIGVGLVLGCSQADWAKLFHARRDSKSNPETRPSAHEVMQANLTAVDAELRAANRKEVMAGTIASLAYSEWQNPILVRGYGLVAELGRNGSKECPVRVREELLDEFRKQRERYRPKNRAKPIPPKQLLESLDTAVVMVSGQINPGAPVGEAFDVAVGALEGTKTRSLEGGTLLYTDLRVYGSSGGVPKPSRELAAAFGPVFVNPFGREAGEKPATPTDLRRGRVIGGGRNLYQRKVKLVLVDPSYKDVARVAAVINSQYPADPPIADARSPQEIVLKIPEEYKHRYRRFLALVMHLYLEDLPGYLDQRSRGLAEIILRKEAPYSDICLCWQGIGRPVLPIIRELYNHENRAAAFWSAVTGLRLGDRLAVGVLAQFANDPTTIFRARAVEELGDAPKGMRTAEVLRPLLADTNNIIRIKAYNALRKMHDRAIRSTYVSEGGYWVDVVDSPGKSMIYASLFTQARIAVFGQDISVEPPVYYRHVDGIDDHRSTLVLSAQAGEEHITAVRRSRVSRKAWPPIRMPLNVAKLITTIGGPLNPDRSGRPTGLALGYSYVVGAIQALYESKAIRVAAFQLERTSVSDIFGPAAPAGKQTPQPQARLDQTGAPPALAAEREVEAVR